MRITAALVSAIAAIVLFSACSEKKAVYMRCNENAKKLVGEPGTEYAIDCPQQCGNGTVYGTDVYTDDSAVCVAAVHAGLIDSAGGRIMLTIEAGRDSYEGSERNGIKTRDWKKPWNRSFTLDD